jgi:hypothetical protein
MMRVESHAIGAAIGLAIGVAVSGAIAIWRPVRLAFFALVALTTAAIPITVGVHFGLSAAVMWVAMIAGMLAVSAAFVFCAGKGLEKIYGTNNPWIQIAVPPLFFIGWCGLCAWMGSSVVFLSVFGFVTLIASCLNAWRVLQWKRAE